MAMTIKATGTPGQLRGLPALARAFSLPHTEEPLRLPSFPAVERTSVLSFNATETLPVGTQPGRSLLFRQPTFPLWTTNLVKGCYYLQYKPGHPTGISAATSTPSAWPLVQAGVGSQTLSNTNTPPPSPAQNLYENFNIVGDALVPGYPWLGADQEGTGQYFFVPKGWTLAVIATGYVPQGLAPNVRFVEFVLDVYTAPGEWYTVELMASQTLRTTVSQGSAAIPAEWLLDIVSGAYCNVFSELHNHWVRLRTVRNYVQNSHSDAVDLGTPVTIIVAPQIQLTVSTVALEATEAAEQPSIVTYNYFSSATATGEALALHPLLTTTAYTASAQPFLNTRLTAVAALFTNVTKALNKEGTVIAARLNPDAVDVWNVEDTTYSDIHPSEKFFYGLENGFYTYAAPSTDLADFRDYTYHLTGTVMANGVVPVFRLDNNAMVNSFTFKDPDGGTQLAVNLDWHIEFRNSSQLWPVALSTIKLEDLHAAQLVMASAGCFFDNIDHQAILSKIAAALRFISPLTDAYPVARAASSAAQYVIAKAIKPKSAPLAVTPKKPPGQPQPTQLQVMTKPRRVVVSRKQTRVARPKQKKQRKRNYGADQLVITRRPQGTTREYIYGPRGLKK